MKVPRSVSTFAPGRSPPRRRRPRTPLRSSPVVSPPRIGRRIRVELPDERPSREPRDQNGRMPVGGLGDRPGRRVGARAPPPPRSPRCRRRVRRRSDAADRTTASRITGSADGLLELRERRDGRGLDAGIRVRPARPRRGRGSRATPPPCAAPRGAAGARRSRGPPPAGRAVRRRRPPEGRRGTPPPCRAGTDPPRPSRRRRDPSTSRRAPPSAPAARPAAFAPYRSRRPTRDGGRRRGPRRPTAERERRDRQVRLVSLESATSLAGASRAAKSPGLFSSIAVSARSDAIRTGARGVAAMDAQSGAIDSACPRIESARAQSAAAASWVRVAEAGGEGPARGFLRATRERVERGGTEPRIGSGEGRAAAAAAGVGSATAPAGARRGGPARLPGNRHVQRVLRRPGARQAPQRPGRPRGHAGVGSASSGATAAASSGPQEARRKRPDPRTSGEASRGGTSGALRHARRRSAPRRPPRGRDPSRRRVLAAAPISAASNARRSSRRGAPARAAPGRFRRASRRRAWRRGGTLGGGLGPALRRRTATVQRREAAERRRPAAPLTPEPPGLSSHRLRSDQQPVAQNVRKAGLVDLVARLLDRVRDPVEMDDVLLGVVDRVRRGRVAVSRLSDRPRVDQVAQPLRRGYRTRSPLTSSTRMPCSSSVKTHGMWLWPKKQTAELISRKFR